MGQKTNSTALRIGKTKEWALKHFEKKSTESSYYIFKEIEIQKFADKFFSKYELKIQKCKIFLNERILHIFISYFATEKSYHLLTELNNQRKLTFTKKNLIFRKKNKKLKKTKLNNKKRFYKFWSQYQNFKSLGSLKHYSKALTLNTSFRNSYRIIRNKKLEHYKKTVLTCSNRENHNFTNNEFVYKFIKSLDQYLNTGGYFTILLTCKHLNKNLIAQFNKKEIKTVKRIIPQLRRYQDNFFFKDGLNIFSQIMVNKQYHKLVADYIAVELGKLKRHSFFLKFVKAALTLFYNQKISNLYGIKIQIKGRINGAPKTKKKIISVGKSIKNLSILYNVNYFESTAFTKSGSFGVKVWLSEKTYL